jgi:hypothetical protein
MREEYPPTANSRIIISANNTLCRLDGATGTTSALLDVYAGVRIPMSYALAEVTNQLVVFTAPAVASTNPMAVFRFGPPHQLLGDFGMVEGGQQFGAELAAGDVIGDATPELFVTTATGGPGIVYWSSPLAGDDFASFFPFEETYNGGFRLALGNIIGDRFQELAVVKVQGGETAFFEFVNGQPQQIGSFNPFPPSPNSPLPSPNNGAFIDFFDLNNGGHAEAVFGSALGPPMVRVVSWDNGEPDVVAEFTPFEGDGGAKVAAGVINGRSSIMVVKENETPRPSFEVFTHTHEFERFRQLAFNQRLRPYGENLSTKLAVEMFFPPR